MLGKVNKKIKFIGVNVISINNLCTVEYEKKRKYDQ